MLQAKPHSCAIWSATEVLSEGDKYFIVPQSGILMLEREDKL